MAYMWIVMDGRQFKVPIAYQSLQRKFDFVDGGQGGIMQSGLETLDTIGTRIGYSLTLPGYRSSQGEYDALYEVLTSPTRVHTITLPYGQSSITFDARIDGGTDTLGTDSGKARTWGNLTLSFTPIRPQKIPEA